MVYINFSVLENNIKRKNTIKIMKKTKKFKIDYDFENDVLFLYDSENKSYESVEVKKDFIVDFDKNNNITAVEIFNFSKGIEEIKEKLKKAFFENKNAKVEIEKTKKEKNEVTKIRIFLDLENIKENTTLLIEENVLLAKV